MFNRIIQSLEQDRAASDEAALFFSGGKDSVVLLDLLYKVYGHGKIHCQFMYLCPYPPLDTFIDKTCRKYGATIERVPHWAYFKFKQAGIYCDEYACEIPTINDYIRILGEKYNTPNVYHGAKKSDSMFRAQTWNSVNCKKPMKDLLKEEILAYIKVNKLDLYSLDKSNASGIDLSRQFLFWCWDNDKALWNNLRKEFRYIDAVIYHKEQYGWEE